MTHGQSVDFNETVGLQVKAKDMLTLSFLSLIITPISCLRVMGNTRTWRFFTRRCGFDQPVNPRVCVKEIVGLGNGAIVKSLQPGQGIYKPKVQRLDGHIIKARHGFVLTTCPLHTNGECGKERRIIFGPW